MAKMPLKDEKPYRRWHRIAYYVFIAGCVMISIACGVGAAAGDFNNAISNRLGYAAIICVAVFYVINMTKWRCPNCRRPLPLFGPVLQCGKCKRVFMDNKGNQIW